LVFGVLFPTLSYMLLLLLISFIKISALLTYIPLKLLIGGEIPVLAAILVGGGDARGFCENDKTVG